MTRPLGLTITLDLPLRVQILKASGERPFLCLKLVLDPLELAETAARVYPEGLPPGQSPAIVASLAGARFLDAALCFL